MKQILDPSHLLHDIFVTCNKSSEAWIIQKIKNIYTVNLIVSNLCTVSCFYPPSLSLSLLLEEIWHIRLSLHLWLLHKLLFVYSDSTEVLWLCTFIDSVIAFTIKAALLGSGNYRREKHINIHIPSDYQNFIDSSFTILWWNKLSWQNMYTYVYLASFKGSADLSTGKASKNTCSYLNN